MTSHSRIVLAGVAVATILIYVVPLFLPTPLLEPDEGLHATIAQEMLEADEWVLPTFCGEPFLDKPILYFWTLELSMHCLGMTEFGVRVPGMLFTLLGAATTGLLATALFHRRIGWLATAVFMTMLIPLSLAQASIHDVALVPWTNLALLTLWRMEHSAGRRDRILWLLGAAAAFALAILTKALIGLAVIGVGYAAFLLLARRLNVGSVTRVATALIIGAVAASPWFLAVENRVPGYLYYYFVERHVMGFATTTQPHGTAPWFYYLPVLVFGSLPWGWYLVPLAFSGIHRSAKINSNRQILYIHCWLLGGLFFLSVARSKLPTYALPLFPAIAVLTAVTWHAYETGQCSRRSASIFRLIVRGAAVVGAVIPIAALIVTGIIADDRWPAFAWSLAAVLGILSWQAGRLFVRQEVSATVGAISVFMAGLTVLVMTWPFQHFSEDRSQKELATWINRQDKVPDHLIIVGEKPHSVLFYLKPEFRAQLRRQGMSVASLPQVASQQHIPHGVVVAATEDSMEKFPDFVSRIGATAEERVGQFTIFRSGREDSSLIHVAKGSAP